MDWQLFTMFVNGMTCGMGLTFLMVLDLMSQGPDQPT